MLSALINLNLLRGCLGGVRKAVLAAGCAHVWLVAGRRVHLFLKIGGDLLGIFGDLPFLELKVLHSFLVTSELLHLLLVSPQPDALLAHLVLFNIILLELLKNQFDLHVVIKVFALTQGIHFL